ncbi:MAG: HNH endonuclease [Polyangiaceae bacterium]|nr:HNH endonuclease [Polyangiaceae bacterium]
MEVNQEARAGKAWNTLINAAAEHKKLTYSELGEAIQVHHRHVSRPLGFIQEYCMTNRLPPLTILVHQKGRGPGAGFIAWDISDLEEGFYKVFHFNWRDLRNPFTYALNGATQDSLAVQLLEMPHRSEDVYRQVRDRGVAQQIFRTVLFEAYSESCAFCGFSFGAALEAAHIIPWAAASARERMNVCNGLLLCATHHRLFDAGLISVTEHHVMDHLPDDGTYTPIEAALTKELHGRKLRLPSKGEYWPAPELLRKRTELQKEASQPRDE